MTESDERPVRLLPLTVRPEGVNQVRLVRLERRRPNLRTNRRPAKADFG